MASFSDLRGDSHGWRFALLNFDQAACCGVATFDRKCFAPRVCPIFSPETRSAGSRPSLSRILAGSSAVKSHRRTKGVPEQRSHAMGTGERQSYAQSDHWRKYQRFLLSNQTGACLIMA
jgi:hypothetical protein